MTSPSPSSAGPLVAGWQAVLAAQHACVFGYPALGTHLTDDAQIDQARTSEAGHRLVRDDVAERLVDLGQTPVAAATGYAAPVALTSAQAAQQWAVALEEDVAAAYRYLLVCAIHAGGAQTAARAEASTGLTGAAEAAVFWRQLVTPNTPTIAFPGTP